MKSNINQFTSFFFFYGKRSVRKNFCIKYQAVTGFNVGKISIHKPNCLFLKNNFAWESSIWTSWSTGKRKVAGKGLNKLEKRSHCALNCALPSLPQRKTVPRKKLRTSICKIPMSKEETEYLERRRRGERRRARETKRVAWLETDQSPRDPWIRPWGNEEAIMSKEMSKCVIGRPKRMNGTELFFVF